MKIHSKLNTIQMKNNLLILATTFTILASTGTSIAQAPTLGTTVNFVLFTSAGAVSNIGTSQITGNVGTNSGSSTAFGNVNGQMHDNDLVSAAAATDLTTAYNQLNGTTPTAFPAPLLGNGTTMNAGVYSIAGATTLNLNLTLNGQGNANAVFIFKIQGSFSANAGARVILTNGVKACNVFWKIEGLVSMAAGSTMRGTIIANNAAINMNAQDTLEGRALSINGAVTVNGVMAYTPIGCGSPVLTGPAAPNLASTGCYAIFSANGPVTNTGITSAIGDVGTNVGLCTGFNTLTIAGTVHPIPDGSTAACAADLLNIYNYLNTLPSDIELLYPAQFGGNLVLTPHTYIMKAATTLTDTLFLNGLNNPNAVFVIQINGSLSTSTYAKVILKNGTQAKNVYWKVDGAVNINNYSVFKGTIVANNGAIALNTGVNLDGRALTTNGALATNASTVNINGACGSLGFASLTSTVDLVRITPNPFSALIRVTLVDASLVNLAQLNVVNVLGEVVLTTTLTKEVTSLETSHLPSGIYFYKVTGNNKVIQSGRLISQQ